MERALVVQHVVGDRRYYVVVDGDDVSVHEGEAEAPTLTFTSDRETADAVRDGTLSAQAAFMAGRLRIGGDLSALGEAADAVSDREAAIRSALAATGYY